MKVRLALCMVVVSTLCLGAWAPARAGLVGYWPLDGDGTAVVGTGGTLVGGPTPAADRNGAAGGALAFASTGPTSGSYVSVAGGGGLNAATTATLSMWVQWNGTQDTGWSNHNGAVLGRQNNGVWSDNVLCTYSSTDPNVSNINWEARVGAGMNSGVIPGDGTWRHVAATMGPAGEVLYVDGVRTATRGPFAGFHDGASIPLTIGAWIGDGASYSTSRIDDVAVYDHVLDPAQVFALAQQSATPQGLPSRIKANAQTPNYYAPDGRRARHVIDGAGLTPDNDGDGIDQHGTTPANTMWLTNNTAPSDQRWIKFELDGLYALDAMRIWNYNEPGGFLGRQVETALVQYSTDGIHWTTLGAGPRTMQTDATGTTAYDNVEHVSFGDAQVRFVRLGNPANPLVQINTSTGDHLGLSEVQFFGDPLPEAEMYQITPAGATASTQYSGREAFKAALGAGLTADSDGDGVDEHDNSYGNMWLSNTGDVTPWIRFDLGADRPLGSMRVWNYNELNLSRRSIKTADIKYAVDGQVGDLGDPNDPGWTLLSADVPFTRADELLGYEAVDEFFFGQAGAMARYVLIDVKSNFGDTAHTGLSEVQFFGVPEPGTYVLMGLGALVLVPLLRRRGAKR